MKITHNSNNSLPTVSIITVVYNSFEFIERTIVSVLNQSYQNIEYIIIDGASNDGTLEIIQKYEQQIDFIISEPDNGLYDAMNKGIKLAKAEYIWFLNSGDQLAEQTTVEKIFGKNTNADVFYGDVMIINSQNKPIGLRRLKPPLKLNWQSLANGMLVSHQAFIVKRNLSPLYNLKFRFAADFEWVLKCLKNSTHIVNTQLVLVKYLDGGLTKKHILAGLKERFYIMKTHYGLCRTLLKHLILATRFMLFVARFRRF